MNSMVGETPTVRQHIPQRDNINPSPGLLIRAEGEEQLPRETHPPNQPTLKGLNQTRLADPGPEPVIQPGLND